MKPGFFTLKEAKRQRILEACFQEFSRHDYEHASLDRIVEAADISKGGLYEYIAAKEDLYLYVVEQAYLRLYDYLAMADAAAAAHESDILRRFRQVSCTAINFYIEYPHLIELIVRTARLTDPDLAVRVQLIFEAQFGRLFDTVSQEGLRFPRQQLIDLMKWLLIKTRNDFMAALRGGADRTVVRQQYLDEWEFLFSVLKNGIYG